MTERNKLIKRMEAADACVDALVWLRALPKDISTKEIWKRCRHREWKEFFFRVTASEFNKQEYRKRYHASRDRLYADLSKEQDRLYDREHAILIRLTTGLTQDPHQLFYNTNCLRCN